MTELDIPVDRVLQRVSNRVVGTITDKGTYTITEIQNGSWGRLKSGAGWINCSASYCKRVGMSIPVAVREATMVLF